MFFLVWFLLPFVNCARYSPPVETIDNNTVQPSAKCEFSVRQDDAHGKLVTGVGLDVQLYYSIRCEPHEGYCLTVSNCTVSPDDAVNAPYPIIDQNGCSLETSLYHHVTYDSAFSAGIFNPMPIRFRGSSSAVLLYCVTTLRHTEGRQCQRFQCPAIVQ